MKRIFYWGLGTLIIFFAVLFCVLFVRYNLSEIEKNDRQIAAIEAASRAAVLGNGSHLSGGSSSYQPPPLGETDETGYWEGNTWRIKPAPKPKKKWWQSDDSSKYIPMLMDSGYKPKELRDKFRDMGPHAFERWIIAEYPYSQAALIARLEVVPPRDWEFLLKYHPHSPLLHAEIAKEEDHRANPEKTVAFAKKALRLLPTTSEDYTHIYPPTLTSHRALGFAYQILGDYKSALVHLKIARQLHKSRIDLNAELASVNLMGYELCSKWIDAIEAGKPILGPKDRKGSASNPSVEMPQLSEDPGSAPAAIPSSSVSVPPDFSVLRESDSLDDAEEPRLSSSDAFLREAMERERAAKDAARSASVSERSRREREFDSFIRWMEAIESASSPADLEDFLMREMAVHLQGGHSAFMPDRLIRAFETLDGGDVATGMRELERLDADLAREIERASRKDFPNKMK